MKKCIIISDSFKGTLSSSEICSIAEDSMSRIFPDCLLCKVPVADGGEGTAACFQEVCGGRMVTVTVCDPFGEPVNASYLQLAGGQAVIEMAAAAGLPLVEGRKDPRKASTYGVGQLIRHAVEHGNRKILLGLGGSCTNDGGCGCAAALGVQFFDKDGCAFVPVGETLSAIRHIDLSGAAFLRNVQLTAMCDIDNPMHGPAGAAYVFAPQKGADPETVAFLDAQLAALDETFRRELGQQVADIPGAGAAGAFGAGMSGFFQAQLRPGIDAVLDLVGFDDMLNGCDMVFTGEGRLDTQSVRGKVLSGVGKMAQKRHVPVIAVVGGITEDAEGICESGLGISAVFTINRQAVPFDESKYASRQNYRWTFDNILRLIKQSQRIDPSAFPAIAQ